MQPHHLGHHVAARYRAGKVASHIEGHYGCDVRGYPLAPTNRGTVAARRGGTCKIGEGLFWDRRGSSKTCFLTGVE